MADQEAFDPDMNKPHGSRPGDSESGPPPPADSARDVPESDTAADGDLAEVEMQLARLQPVASRVDRDELMFLAGREEVLRLRRSWFWPSATLVCGTLAASLAVMLMLQNGTLSVRHPPLATQADESAAEPLAAKSAPGTPIEVTPPGNEESAALSPTAGIAGEPQSSAPVESLTSANYFQQRSKAISQGVDSLPGPAATSFVSPAVPTGYGTMRKVILGPGIPNPTPTDDGKEINSMVNPIDFLPF